MPSAARVVVVADRSGDRLPAGTQDQVARGWSTTAPHVAVEPHLSHDGGPGFAAVVAERATATGAPATTHPVLVPGPSGPEVPAAITLVRADRGTTAYLDAAQVAGRHLVDEARLADPAGLSSAGVGELLLRATELGAQRIVVGVGPAASHDGGVGLLAALGAGADLSRLAEVRRDWTDVELVLATTTEASLLGFHGASASLGEHGVAPEVTQRLETELGGLSDRVNAVLPPPRDLLTGLPRRPERSPGSGTGGGVGYALQLLGARTDTGARLLLDEFGVRPRLVGALVVLVTDVYDYTTVHDGVVADTARAAAEVAAPTLVLAREVAVGRREGMSLGVSGSYAARGEEDLGALAARVARTWTPGTRS
ncbi:glycerate kinase [Serinicoccus kebangsaanensis]|uniref:glycerate kinase n=1 Tax=Serinicoccus kebangsaanensis TaxID=2602069 RepID=UPI00124DD3E1|nr:glycerate kinase [Serinicoccus kebangsaanensis]